MSNIRKWLEKLGLKATDPSPPICTGGTIIQFPRRPGCEGKQPPSEQPPPWEASSAPGTCLVWVLHPRLLYPDLQNLPFDPMVEFIKEAEWHSSKQRKED